MPVSARKLMVTIGLDGDQVVIKKIREIDNALDRAGGSGGGVAKFGKVRDVMQGIIGPASEVFTAIKGGGEIAYRTGEFLFGLAKSAADAGSEIQDLSEQTGLSAETISSLRAATVTTKVSVEDMAGGINKLSKTVAEAARGSQEAKDKLIRLGIDPQSAVNDLEGALDKAFQTIYNAPPGVKQTSAAIDAFGKSGAKLQGVVIAAGGSVEELKKQSKALGTQISTADARAADEFGDTLATLTLQAQTTGFTFARQFTPEITGTMKEISQAMSSNRDKAAQWGEGVANAIRGVRDITREDGAEILSWLRIATAIATLGASELALFVGGKIGTAIHDKGMKSRANDPSLDPNDPANRSKAGSQAAGIYADQQRRQADLSGYELGSKHSGGSANGADKVYQNAVNAAKNAAEQIVDTVQSQTAALDREYRLQIKSIDEYVTESKRLIAQKQKAIEAEADAEKAAILKRTGITGEERNQLLADANKKAIKAVREAAAAIQAVEDKAADDRLNKSRSDYDQDSALQDEKDRARIARNRASAEDRADAFARAHQLMTEADAAAYEYRRTLENVSYEESEKVAARVEQDAFDRRRSQLQKELGLVKDNVGERKRIQAELTLLAQRERSFQEESRRRRQEAHDKDVDLQHQNIENARAHAQAIAEYDAQVAESGANVERVRLESIIRSSGPFSKARQQAIAKIGVLDVDEIEQRRLHNRRLLIAQKDQLIEETSNAEERLKIREQYNKLLAEEDARSDEEKRHRIKQGNRDVSMAGPGGAFDAGMATGQIIQGMQQMEDGTWKFAGAVNVAFSAVGAVVNGLADAVGNLYEQWILMGDAGGQSFSKVTATLLASVARQAAVQALMCTAYGIAALTPWGHAIYGSPAVWFKAALVFGAVAGIAGGAGRAIAGDKFKSGGSSAPGAAPDYSQFGQQGFAGNQSIRSGYGATGSSRDAHNIAVARAIDKLTARLDKNDRLADKIDSMRAGDVLVRGIGEKRGLVGATVNKELASSTTLRTEMGRRLGFA